MPLVGRPGHELWVSEIFGPTVQGEGPSMGRRAMFIRLAGCNLACVWCDTKYTWDWANYDRNKEATLMTQMQASALLEDMSPKAVDLAVDLLVITGGEPLLQRKSLSCFDALHAYDRVEIETNGTVNPEHLLFRDNVWFNVSPKLAHSGNLSSRTFVPQAMHELASHKRAIFKFVVQSAEDLDEIENWIEYGKMYNVPIWIMPEGTHAWDLSQHMPSTLADEVVRRGWNLTTRLHVLTWGNERGR